MRRHAAEPAQEDSVLKLDTLERALRHVQRELEAVALFEGCLDQIEVVLAYWPSGWWGECGFVYDRGVGGIAKLAGFREGVIYLPRNAPISRRRGETLRDVLRHEYAHALAWARPSFVRGAWFREAFGAGPVKVGEDFVGAAPCGGAGEFEVGNLGGDFGVVGNEEVVTTGKGTTYGFEFFAQQKLTKRFFGTFSYTFFVSRYSGLNGKEIASAWDNRHLLSFIWGYKFNRNWELGLKFRYQGGAPYTPFDLTTSQLNYLTFGTGILDYSQLNSQRLEAFHASDIRIDKKWNYRKTTLNLFLDITNWYKAINPSFPQYTFRRTADNTAFLTTDGQPIRQDGSNGIPVFLDNSDASVIPTIGFIVEF